MLDANDPPITERRFTRITGQRINVNADRVRTVELHPGDLLPGGARVIEVIYDFDRMLGYHHDIGIDLLLLVTTPDGPQVVLDSGGMNRHTVLIRLARTAVYDEWSLPNSDRLCSACGQFHEPDGSHNCDLAPHLSIVTNA